MQAAFREYRARIDGPRKNFRLHQTTAFMTWVKICGITNLEDALTAVEAGADAIGFVFYEKSSRRVAENTVRDIVAKLPRSIEKVGVFVDADCNEMHEIVRHTGLTAVQAHGGRSGESLRQERRPPMECVGVSKLIGMIRGDELNYTGIGIEESLRKRLFALLLDSQVNGAAGGTGTTFAWEAAREMVQALSLLVPVIIAGGLTAGNVSDALKMFRPFGVDVVSGVEALPGKKDPTKVRAFVRAVREIDRQAS